MKDYREDIDNEAIKKYLMEREEPKALTKEKIKEIYEIIQICKSLSDKEKEKKRYEIRNLCK